MFVSKERGLATVRKAGSATQLRDKTPSDQATVVQMNLPFRTAEGQRLPLLIKTEGEGEEKNRQAKGPRVIQSRSLRDILRWVGPEHVKEEPGENLPQGWEGHSQEHPTLIQVPHLGWDGPYQPEVFRRRPRGSRNLEQQVPVLYEDMDVNSPESEHSILDRRRYLRREAKQRSERGVRSLVTARSVTPISSFTKTSRRGTNWSYSEVLNLLDIWGEQRIQQVLQSSHRNMDTFQIIANEMAKRGHLRTAQECRTKTKTLRRDYKKVKESNSVGRGQSTCPFYDQLEQILESAGPRPLGRKQSLTLQEELGKDAAPLQGPEEACPNEASRDYLEGQDLFYPSVDLADPITMACKMENVIGRLPPTAVGSDLLPNPLRLATQSIPGSPATTGSTTEVHLTPSHSPVPAPTGLSAAERLANLRNRHKKTRTDLAVELARAADLRVQEATDRILSALDDYTKADLADREKDRAGTEQIIAIMQRQTELLELLVRQQTSTPAAVPVASSRHGWPPRMGPSNHWLVGHSSARLALSRWPLTTRVRNWRRSQNYSP